MLCTSTPPLKTSPDSRRRAAACHSACSPITRQREQCPSHAGRPVGPGACCILLPLVLLIQLHPAACHGHPKRCRANPPASSSAGGHRRSSLRREDVRRGGGMQVSPTTSGQAALEMTTLKDVQEEDASVSLQD